MSQEIQENQDIFDLSDEQFEASINTELMKEDTPEEIENELTENSEENKDALEQPENVKDSNNEKMENDVVNEDSKEEKPEENIENQNSDENENKTSEQIEKDNLQEDSKDKEPVELTEEMIKDMTFNIKASGKKYDLNIDELKKLAMQGFDYTKKTQKIKPYSTLISKLEEAKLGSDQLDLMIDALKGNKDAIAEVLKQNKIEAMDLLDIEEDKDYTPKKYGKTESQIELEEVFEILDQDPESGKITKNVIGNEWDDSSFETIMNGIDLGNGQKYSSRDIILGLNEEVKNGTYEKVSTIARKMKALNPNESMSDLDWYIKAGLEYKQNEQKQEKEKLQVSQNEQNKKAQLDKIAEMLKNEKIENAKKQKQEIEKNNSHSAKKQLATPTANKTGGNATIVDYLDTSMSDDEFNELMEKELGY